MQNNVRHASLLVVSRERTIWTTKDSYPTFWVVNASEADVLNMALFGMTAKQWRKTNPDKKGNIRDYSNEYPPTQSAESLYLYKVGKTIMSKPFNRLYHLVNVIQSPVPHRNTGTEPIENSQFSILNSQSFGAVNA